MTKYKEELLKQGITLPNQETLSRISKSCKPLRSEQISTVERTPEQELRDITKIAEATKQGFIKALKLLNAI